MLYYDTIQQRRESAATLQSRAFGKDVDLRSVGIFPLSPVAPAHDPVFDRIEDTGEVEKEDEFYRIKWSVLPRPIEVIKSDLAAKVADCRWQLEVSDFEVDGVVYSGNRTDISLLDQAIWDAQIVNAAINFKAKSGSVLVTADELMAARGYYGRRRQAVRRHERMICEKISASNSVGELRAIKTAYDQEA